MADHWKSLANKLGAPGVDEPEEVVEHVPQAEAEPTSGEEQADSPLAPAEDAPDSDDGSELEGAASPQADAEADSPEVIHALAPPKAQPTPTPVEEPQAKRKKRRSSWEKLASMFNVSSGAAEQELEEEPAESPEAEPDPAPARASGSEVRVADTGNDEPDEDERPGLALFDAPEKDVNPALESMFGDAPRDEDLSWTPRRKRVVDDVGWGETDASKDDEAAERDEGSSSPARADRDRTSDDEDEMGRGRSRRRRRGRRGRGRDADPASELDSGDSPEASADERWSGPTDIGDGDDEGEEVERRSNRRRRRGRGRSDAERARSDGERPENDKPQDVGWSDEAEDDDGEGEERVASRRRPRRGERSERGDSRRRGRSRGAERQERDERPERDSRQEDSAEDADDDQDSETPKHRNIPTWADALQTLVESNIENHKRNEGNRGGNRGRRGRRS